MSILQKLTEGIQTRNLQQEGDALLEKWERTGLLEGIGWVKEFLNINEEGKPRLLFFNTCINLLKEFRQYRWDSKSKNDRPKKQFDHALDCLRYEIMQFKRYNNHR